MIRKIFGAASWLGAVQIFNTLSVLILTAYVVKNSSVNSVSVYMYAVFMTDAVMSYSLMQVSQRVILSRSLGQFKRNYHFGLGLSKWNAVVSMIFLVAVASYSFGKFEEDGLFVYSAWLGFAAVMNCMAGFLFVKCDYEIDYRPYAVASIVGNFASILVAVVAFQYSQSVSCMVARDVVRALVFFSFALYFSRELTFFRGDVRAHKHKFRVGFVLFVLKRHVLKMIEVTNHRVPALLMAGGAIGAVGEFGVAFQFISQILGLMAIVSDRVAYAWFSKSVKANNFGYLSCVSVLYALGAIVIYFVGSEIFLVIYGEKWASAAKIFSTMGVYLFTHGVLVLLSNFLLTRKRFLSVYIAWASWLVCFLAQNWLIKDLEIVDAYVIPSACSCVIVFSAFLLSLRSAGFSQLPVKGNS